MSVEFKIVSFAVFVSVVLTFLITMVAVNQNQEITKGTPIKVDGKYYRCAEKKVEE